VEKSLAVSRSVARTEGVIGKSCTACFAAAIRIRQLAIFGVMVNLGENLELWCKLSAVDWLSAMPLLCR